MKTIPKSSVQIVSFLWLGSLFGAGLAFLTQVILARNFSLSEYGIFSSAFALVALLIPLAGFGISKYWLKVFGLEGWSANRWMIPSFYFISLTVLLSTLSLCAWAIFGLHDEIMTNILFILSLYLIGQTSIELVSSKLQLEEEYTKLALWQFFPHFGRFLGVLLLLFVFKNNVTIVSIAIVYAIIAIVLCLIAFVQLKIMLESRLNLKGHGLKDDDTNRESPSVLAVLSNVWPFGLAGIFHMIYFQSDIVLTKYITGAEAAGIYNVAFIIIVAVYLFPNVIYQKFLLPKFHRWAHHDRDKFYKIYKKGNFIMLIAGMLFMIGVFGLADFMLSFLFGPKYEGSIAILHILAIAIPIHFVATSVGATLVTSDHMKRKVYYMGFVAIVNIVLNLVLIPKYGANGAAIATVSSEFVLLSIYYVAANKIVFADMQQTK